jgi:cell wall-associated NlpC family hydrolase
MAAAAAVCVAMPIATAQAAPKSYGSRTLAKPMRGPDVRELQRLLTAWGLPTAIDGQFGRHTKLRVRSWERNSDRRINGRMSRSEAIALRDAVARGETLPGYTPEPDETDPDYTATATEKATLGPDGLAIAPPSAPAEVKAIIDAGNEIAKKPYKYGGGHAKQTDSGYDCSGSMSYALRAAGLVDESLDSTGFMSWEEAGKGQWVTTYAHGGHSYMVVAGLRFDTSGLDEDGSRWHTTRRSARGYTVRHPEGL